MTGGFEPAALQGCKRSSLRAGTPQAEQLAQARTVDLPVTIDVRGAVRGEQVGACKLVIRFTPASLRDEYIPKPSRISKYFRETTMPKAPMEMNNRF